MAIQPVLINTFCSIALFNSLPVSMSVPKLSLFVLICGVFLQTDLLGGVWAALTAVCGWVNVKFHVRYSDFANFVYVCILYETQRVPMCVAIPTKQEFYSHKSLCTVINHNFNIL